MSSHSACFSPSTFPYCLHGTYMVSRSCVSTVFSVWRCLVVAAYKVVTDTLCAWFSKCSRRFPSSQAHTPISCIVDEVLLINKFFWFTKTGSCYLFFSFAVCDYFAHEECKEFSVSDCKKCASYSPYVQKVLSYHSRLYPFGMLQHHIGGVCWAMFWILTWHCYAKVPMEKPNELICCWSEPKRYD